MCGHVGTTCTSGISSVTMELSFVRRDTDIVPTQVTIASDMPFIGLATRLVIVCKYVSSGTTVCVAPVSGLAVAIRDMAVAPIYAVGVSFRVDLPRSDLACQNEVGLMVGTGRDTGNAVSAGR